MRVVLKSASDDKLLEKVLCLRGPSDDKLREKVLFLAELRFAQPLTTKDLIASGMFYTERRQSS